MFSKSVFLLFVLCFLAIYASSPVPIKMGTKPETCPMNEEPTDCVEYCLPTCDKPKRPFCIFKACYAGCVCKEGYIRETDTGRCVPISSCVNPGDVSRNYTEPCKENELLTECVACEPSCEHLDAAACLLLWCPAGCVCKEGFVRNTNGGDCVPITSCTKIQ